MSDGNSEIVTCAISDDTTELELMVGLSTARVPAFASGLSSHTTSHITLPVQVQQLDRGADPDELSAFFCYIPSTSDGINYRLPCTLALTLLLQDSYRSLSFTAPYLAIAINALSPKKVTQFEHS